FTGFARGRPATMLRSILLGCIACCCVAAAPLASAQGPAPAPAPPAAVPSMVLAQTAKQPPADAPDLTKPPTLLVVGYAHLDTEWRWDYPQVINEYLKATLDKNFALIQKYPHY